MRVFTYHHAGIGAVIEYGVISTATASAVMVIYGAKTL